MPRRAPDPHGDARLPWPREWFAPASADEAAAQARACRELWAMAFVTRLRAACAAVAQHARTGRWPTRVYVHGADVDAVHPDWLRRAEARDMAWAAGLDPEAALPRLAAALATPEGAARLSALLEGQPLPQATPRDPLETPDLSSLVAEVAAATGVQPEAIVAQDRRPAVAAARFLVMHIARHVQGWSLAAIGRALGRDQATIYNGVWRAGRMLRRDPAYAATAAAVALRLEGRA